jgi:hypothetical protein
MIGDPLRISGNTGPASLQQALHPWIVMWFSKSGPISEGILNAQAIDAPRAMTTYRPRRLIVRNSYAAWNSE